MRDQELIRRDIQIATLMAENLNLRAERDLARAQAQAYELASSRDEMLRNREGFMAELAAARHEASPFPPATPPSGEPLRVATDLGPTEAPGT